MDNPKGDLLAKVCSLTLIVRLMFYYESDSEDTASKADFDSKKFDAKSTLKKFWKSMMDLKFILSLLSIFLVSWIIRLASINLYFNHLKQIFPNMKRLPSNSLLFNMSVMRISCLIHPALVRKFGPFALLLTSQTLMNLLLFLHFFPGFRGVTQWGAIFGVTLTPIIYLSTALSYLAAPIITYKCSEATFNLHLALTWYILNCTSTIACRWLLECFNVKDLETWMPIFRGISLFSTATCIFVGFVLFLLLKMKMSLNSKSSQAV